MVLLTIKVQGFTGNFRADVIPFNRENKELIIRIMQGLGLQASQDMTLAELRESAQSYGDTYPSGFKHIHSIFCFYECLG